MGYETSYIFVNMGGSILFLIFGGLIYVLILMLATRYFAQRETNYPKLQFYLKFLRDKFFFNRFIVFWDGTQLVLAISAFLNLKYCLDQK